MSQLDPREYFGKDFAVFADTDPFNGNFAEGYVSRKSSDLYGALLIERVNHDDCPQLIHCTPKIPYPFDKTGNWHFPKATRIERYEKLDGTNLFNYGYDDSKGNKYYTYKTRLLPFVNNSRFGPFRDMLGDILKRNGGLRNLPELLGMNISFELWGARNPHLIKYENPLELSILFARRGQKMFPPSAMNLDGNMPTAEFRGVVDRDYVRSYRESQEDMDGKLVDGGDGYYAGVEGEVWYLLAENGEWQPFKCKPGQIEAIHWSAGGIAKNQIVATCENALENWDNPTVENIATLLLEEFPQHEIDKVYYRIKGYLDEVIRKHLFVEQVMGDYRELNMSILENKAMVMRALSGKYDRKEMKRIFSVIWKNVVR